MIRLAVSLTRAVSGHAVIGGWGTARHRGRVQLRLLLPGVLRQAPAENLCGRKKALTSAVTYQTRSQGIGRGWPCTRTTGRRAARRWRWGKHANNYMATTGGARKNSECHFARLLSTSSVSLSLSLRSRHSGTWPPPAAPTCSGAPWCVGWPP